MNKRMSDERLAEIRARCEAATPGPWQAEKRSLRILTHCDFGREKDGSRVIVRTGGIAQPGTDGPANAAFIANASTDIPDLLDEIIRLRAELHDQSDDVQANWASPAETVGMKQEIAKLRAELAEFRDNDDYMICCLTAGRSEGA